jgi:hypothetical protein
MKKIGLKNSNWSVLILAVTVVVSLAVAYIFYSSSQPNEMPYYAEKPGNLSLGEPIHWHPHLRIVIDGEDIVIPGGIGIVIGKVMDTNISRMGMSPMHTHSDDGVIHMEQVNPTNRTLKLGYFFEVWGENFNSTCILGYCNSANKIVKMFVNGKRNYEFADYFPQDKDDIIIRYERDMFNS